jgi:hypothetical protein
MGTRITPLALLLAAGAACAHAQKPTDAALIASAQRVSVRTLDSSFTATPFAEWVATLRPSVASRIRWELNDCGEGGDGRKAPFCAEAVLPLGPDTTAHASLMVASTDRVVAGPPVIAMLYVVAGKDIVHFKTLTEWAAFVRARPRE